MIRPEKKRKKRWIVVLIVLLVLGAVAGTVWNRQKNNIEAVIQFTQFSQEELETKLEETDQKVAEILNDAMTNAQKVDQELQQTQQTEQPVQTVVPEEETDAPAEEPAPSVTTYEAQLQALVDRVYALRDSFLQSLENLEHEAVEAYYNLPAEQKTAKGKVEFASGYISKATELEKQCDREMDDIVAELTKLQNSYGQSLELVETVKYTYANEKSLKKAWYMSELERRGMI